MVVRFKVVVLKALALPMFITRCSNNETRVNSTVLKTEENTRRDCTCSSFHGRVAGHISFATFMVTHLKLREPLPFGNTGEALLY